MAEPMMALSPEKLNSHPNSMLMDDDFDMTFHDPPSSPFVSHIENEEQENIAPKIAPTPSKPLLDLSEDMPRSAFKASPEKKISTTQYPSPAKNLMGDFEEAALKSSHKSPRKSSPVKQTAIDHPKSWMNGSPRKSQSPSTSSHAHSIDSTRREQSFAEEASQVLPTPCKLPSSSHQDPLRDNEGLTIAMKHMEETRTHTRDNVTKYNPQGNDLEVDLEVESTDSNPDGPDMTLADVDDTCFSTFSEMPGIDMTKFAFLRQSPTKGGPQETTPRARPEMTPSTIRRSERSSSPTPRRTYKENDTTNLLLDFTAQIESFSSSRRTSPARGRTSPTKSSTQPDLRSYYQNQRSPAKGGSYVPGTPSQSRQMFNLLDFELPPPPTPRSLPTVTIREMESVKSQFQSQISSLSASLSGKEAEVEALAKAVADAERRVGEAHETVREERSAREYAEAQMSDWKKKGEEVQKLLQDVQAELARNDSERDQLLARVAEAERRAEEADNRSSDLETKIIEAESKNVDMTTFINNDEGENKKIYSEVECQAAIAEKVNEVARDLHSAYKAKHEKKIKALKDNYQKKVDERCKELRVQIIRLERQVEEAEKKRDNTFSKIMPGDMESVTGEECEKCGKDAKPPSSTSSSNPEDIQILETQRGEIEGLKARLAGLQSELQSLRTTHESLLEELEAERIEKGELVAAAEQMLAMCGEKMEEMQQEDLRRSQIGTAPPAPSTQRAPPEQQAMRNTGFLAGGGPTTSRPGSALGNVRPGSGMGDRLGAMNERGAGGSGIAKPSGLRAPGGFGFQGGAPGLNRSTSGSKSRLLSNIERMGGSKTQT